MNAASTEFLRRMAPGPSNPDQLESFGKQAARLAETNSLTLTDAVIQVLGGEKLGSEQVRRVVEFANIEAFHRKYSSLDPCNRVVHLDGGPADASQVLQTLGSRTFGKAASMDDYDFPPEQKIASVPVECYIPRTPSGSLGEIFSLQSQLRSAHEELVQGVEAAKFAMVERLVALRAQVKKAAADGATAGDLLSAWAAIDPELAKVAYGRVDDLVSGDKVAGRRINPNHPTVRTFEQFAKVAQDYAARQRALGEIEAQLTRVSEWMNTHKGWVE